MDGNTVIFIVIYLEEQALIVEVKLPLIFSSGKVIFIHFLKTDLLWVTRYSILYKRYMLFVESVSPHFISAYILNIQESSPFKEFLKESLVLVHSHEAQRIMWWTHVSLCS